MDLNFFHAIPPVTKACVLGLATVFVLIHCHIVTGPMLSFVPAKIIKGEVWRIFTGFFYLGQSDITTVLSVAFFYISSMSLESTHYLTSKAYLKRLLFLAVMDLAICMVLGTRDPATPILSAIDSLVQMRQEGHFRRISLIPVPEVLQPFQFIIMSLVFNDIKDALAQATGLVLGHILFVYEDVFTLWN